MRIINVISRTDAYILIRDLNLKPKAAGTIDVDTLILSELKSLRNLSMANDIIISEIDFNYIVDKIVSMSGGSGGGTASYPSFTGNADKVLTVNATEDDVEWKTAVTGGGGSGGGINVIEYDPSLHEVVLDTVVGADFVPVNGTCTYNTTTKDIEIATPIMLNNVVRLGGGTYNAEYVGVKLNNEFNAGELTIDVTNCTSNFGMVLIPPTMTLEDFLTNYHGYSYSYEPSYNPVNPSEIFGRVGDNWEYRTLNNDGYGGGPVYGGTNLMSLTLVVATYLTAYSQIYSNMSEEEVVSLLEHDGFNLQEPVFIDLSNTSTAIRNIKEYDLYFFMLAQGNSGTTGTLAPTDKLKITHTLSEKVNIVPAEAVDGDFLHLLGYVKLLGKDLVSGDFVQLYDNTSKMIVHANQP